MKNNAIKLCWSLLSPCTVNTVTYSYDTSAVHPQLLLAKDRQILYIFFQVCTICNKNWQDEYKD